MSKRSSKRASVVCLALLLQLAAGLAAPFGLSLCIAEDGHATLERAHPESACKQEIERHHPGLGQRHLDEFAQHPCRDLELSTTQGGPGSSQPRIEPLACNTNCYLEIEATRATTRRACAGGTLCASGVLERRTVVLLV